MKEKACENQDRESMLSIRNKYSKVKQSAQNQRKETNI